MADDNELIKEKGKSIDSGAVRQKKGSYDSKKKDLAKKLHVTSETGKGWYKGNSNERIVPIKLGGASNARHRFKSEKGHMEG